MNTQNDGGPAFPFPESERDYLEDKSICRGMSLRDWFAGTAPSDLIDPKQLDEARRFLGKPFPAAGTLTQQCAWSMAVEAKGRYLYADAMLAARLKS